jgi:hypothetical protein
MQRKKTFIVAFFLTALWCGAKSQNLQLRTEKNAISAAQRSGPDIKQINFFSTHSLATEKPSPPNFVFDLRQKFNAQELPFFCKKEWQFEKSTHIPFRFRLGSLDYCNALEGKGNLPVRQ